MKQLTQEMMKEVMEEMIEEVIEEEKQDTTQRLPNRFSGGLLTYLRVRCILKALATDS